jgi:hypothetical protein
MAHRSSYLVLLEELIEMSHRGDVANELRNYLGTSFPKLHRSDLKHFDKKYFLAPFVLLASCQVAARSR